MGRWKIGIAGDKDSSAPLYSKYPQQVNAQPAYLEVDIADETAIFDYSDNVGGMGYRSGTMYISTPPTASRDSLEKMSKDRKLMAWLDELVDSDEPDMIVHAIENYFMNNIDTAIVLENEDFWEYSISRSHTDELEDLKQDSTEKAGTQLYNWYKEFLSDIDLDRDSVFVDEELDLEDMIAYVEDYI